MYFFGLFVLFWFVEYICGAEYHKCDDGIQCLHEYGFCNGKATCKDGSDEFPEKCASEIHTFQILVCFFVTIKWREPTVFF